MGRTKVNQREVVTPMPRMKVAELKELALVPTKDKLYDKTGRVLRDDELVNTDDAEFGAVTDWTRGGEIPDKPGEPCAFRSTPFLDGEKSGPLAAHKECLPPDVE